MPHKTRHNTKHETRHKARHKAASESLRLLAELHCAAVSDPEMVKAEPSTQDLFVQARKLRAHKASAEVRPGRYVIKCSLILLRCTFSEVVFAAARHFSGVAASPNQAVVSCT